MEHYYKQKLIQNIFFVYILTSKYELELSCFKFLMWYTGTYLKT